MSESVIKLFESIGGEFVSPPSVFTEKLSRIRGILFDWDGVFNDGFKTGDLGSPFSEVDAMGTNLLRFALWKRKEEMPVVGIVSGEANPAAQALGEREHFHEIYSLSKNKSEALKDFCVNRQLRAEEILYIFDDVLDLSIAKECGLRMMVGRKANPMLEQFSKKNSLVDYITAHDGGHHAVRESCELVIGVLGVYDEVVSNRIAFSREYQDYLEKRQMIVTNSRQMGSRKGS